MKKVKLEEEILIIQFAQGVRSEADLLAYFARLDEAEKRSRTFDMFWLINEAEAADFATKRASAKSADDDRNVYSVRNGVLRRGLRIRTGEEDLESYYTELLNLFKTAYQRRVAREKKTVDDWWYRDLSSEEMVQAIVTSHRVLINEIYQHPSFRGEFASIAKLWHLMAMAREAKLQEPVPTTQEKYHFVSYNDVLMSSTRQEEDYKYSRPASLLFNSLARALSKQYHLNHFRAVQVIHEIVGRHTRELYTSEDSE